MDVFDLGILRLALERRCGCSLQVYVEEAADVVLRHSNLAAAIEVHNAEAPHHAHRRWTLQHRSIAEHVVIHTSNRDPPPAVAGQAVVNRADVRSGLADRLGGVRVGGLPSMVAQEKHERLSDALGDDTAEGSTVHVDTRLAARIIMAELQGCGTTERVAEDSDRSEEHTSELQSLRH